jgi:hypothetical protein
MLAVMLGLIPEEGIDRAGSLFDWNMAPHMAYAGWHFAEVAKALDRARQARFEFGANGN